MKKPSLCPVCRKGGLALSINYAGQHVAYCTACHHRVDGKVSDEEALQGGQWSHLQRRQGPDYDPNRTTLRPPSSGDF